MTSNFCSHSEHFKSLISILMERLLLSSLLLKFRSSFLCFSLICSLNSSREKQVSLQYAQMMPAIVLLVNGVQLEYFNRFCRFALCFWCSLMNRMLGALSFSICDNVLSDSLIGLMRFFDFRSAKLKFFVQTRLLLLCTTSFKVRWAERVSKTSFSRTYGLLYY